MNKATLHKIRQSPVAQNIAKFAGFDYYEFSPAEVSSPQYKGLFDEAYDNFSGALKVAMASDAADIVLKQKYFGKKRLVAFNTLVDYALFYAFAIKDWAYCRRHETDFDMEKTAIRFTQTMGGAALKNPETALGPLRDITPVANRFLTRYMPLKTAFVAGMLFERADERYDNLHKRAAEAASSQ